MPGARRRTGARLIDSVTFEVAVRLAVALGIGLLVGAERERRMAERGRRGTAGVRTFALLGLLGGIAEQIGGDAVLAVALAFVGGAALVSYFRERTPGMTTEVAQVVTFLLGVLAQREPAVASALAATITILLATRTSLHRFIGSVLTDAEVHDALLFAAAALVVLPLLPNRAVGPFEVLNPFAVWRLVVLLMAISSAGYIVVRSVGPRYGLAVAGLLGGFVSSTATIGAMGTRARDDPSVLRGAVAGALFSTVATIAQMAAVLGATSAPTLEAMAWPLALGGAGALAAAGLSMLGRHDTEGHEAVAYSRAFDLRAAVLLAGTITLVTVLSAAAAEAAGSAGVRVAALLGGLADTHAAAIGVASVVAAGKLEAADATLAVLAALTTNTVSKIVFAFIGGGPRFAAPVGTGLVFVMALAWSGLALA